ncbi:MAG: amidase, partial [Acidiferrobacteraceae bacterium]|nr:amidase [Acidiferrobacteraceae bacterium]
MIGEEYDRYDAIGLAGLIAKKELTPSELIETTISRIESLNPKLNAIIARCFDTACDSIAQGLPAGPLTGVPYLVKDLNTVLAGLPATNGSRAFAKTIPTKDGLLISRLKAAGLVILGKTNTPEFGLNICTSPMLFGPTVNPFDHSRSAGGSSGGSACAVASGMLPAAHATDSGGSIRIPASNCGLFGLKPTRARVPLGHDRAEGLAGFSVAHALTHSVRDSAMLLDVTHGPMPGAIYSAPELSGTFLESLEGDLPDLRVGLCTDGFAGEDIDSQCKQAATDAGLLCQSLGCKVEEAMPPVDGVALR